VVRLRYLTAKPVFAMNAGITWLSQKQKKNNSYSCVYSVYTWPNYIGRLKKMANGRGTPLTITKTLIHNVNVIDAAFRRRGKTNEYS